MKTIRIILLSVGAIIGLVLLYRASLNDSDFKVVTGTVIDKQISHFTDYRTGAHYSLIFAIKEQQDKIAINLGTKEEAEKDHTYNLIDISKTYKFYIDPTVITENGVCVGIRRIDYNGRQIFKASNALNLYGGIAITLISIAGIIFVIKYKKKTTANNMLTTLKT